MPQRNITLTEIANILQIQFIGKDQSLNGLNLCNKTSHHNAIITYITSSKFLRYLKGNSCIKAVLVNEELYNSSKESFSDLACFILQNPENEFYNLHHYLFENTDFYDNYNFKSEIGINSSIKQTAIIEEGVIIGENVSIGYNSIIKKGSIIGNNVVIGNNTVISSEGFQLVKNDLNQNTLIKHVGGCTIADNVFIGDNCTVGNSLFENTTYIGKNTKIDNLVHVAHNCVIGANCVLTAGVILSGSTIIKDNVWLAPNCTVSNKVILNENAFVGIGSVVIKSVKENERVFGNPSETI